MIRTVRAFSALLVPLALLPVSLSAQTNPVSSDVIAKIRDEGMNHSQVMQTLSYLSDVIGPRLTGSAQLKRANEWTKSKMTEWGLQNAHLEAWGPFGRGWTLEKFSAQVVSPSSIPLIAYPKAWSPGWRGRRTAEVVMLDAADEAGLAKYKGTLQGKIVLISPMREVTAHFTAQGNRRTDEELTAMETGAPRPRPNAPTTVSPTNPATNPVTPPRRQAPPSFALGAAKMKMAAEEGALCVMDAGRGDGGTIFVQQATALAPSRGKNDKPAPPVSVWAKKAKIVPQVSVSAEQYNRIMRILGAGEKVKIEIELASHYDDKDLMAYNTVAEITGSDLKEQVVMLGGHLDSWQSGTGATDNGAGCAVAMEAVRILKALNLSPRRTIRVALWSGEEQGLFGSRNYCTQHFGSKAEPKPENSKISAYYNLDNGTGKIRGVYLQGNETVRPIFKEWLEPFKDLGATTLTISNTGGTDHLSFDAVGIPGFQFIQDEIEYDSRTHHSNQDVFDRIQGEDMKQAATIMAAFIYETAMRDEMLPRKVAK